jgi:hypothetical protein
MQPRGPRAQSQRRSGLGEGRGAELPIERAHAKIGMSVTVEIVQGRGRISARVQTLDRITVLVLSTTYFGKSSFTSI